MGDLGNLMGFSRVLIGDSLGLEKAKRPLAETYCMPLYDIYIYISENKCICMHMFIYTYMYLKVIFIVYYCVYIYI